MTLTVKLDKDLERQLDLHCRIKRLTKSAVVSTLIENYLVTHAMRPSPYELARTLKLVGAQRQAPAAGREHSRFLKKKLGARRAG